MCNRKRLSACAESMLTLLLRLILLLSAGWLLPIAIIRAQPYDDRDLRTLLTPPDCPVPCFLGIQPGVSSSADALTILSQRPDVHSVRNELNYSRPELTESIYWEWDNTESNRFEPNTTGEIHIAGDRVRRIGVDSRIALGDLWQTFGPPQTTTLLFSPRLANGIVFYEGVYPDERLRLALLIPCPPRDFWWHTVIFTWSDALAVNVEPAADDLAHQVQAMCQQ